MMIKLDSLSLFGESDKTPNSLPLLSSITPELLLLTLSPIVIMNGSFRQGPPGCPLTQSGVAAELTSYC